MEFWFCFVNVLWWHSFFVTLSIKINTIISTIGNICHKWLVGLGKSTVDQVFRETACPSLGWIHLASCPKISAKMWGLSPMSPWGLAATQVFEPQAAIEEGCLASMARCWDATHLVTSCCMLQECRGSQNLSSLKIKCFDLWILKSVGFWYLLMMSCHASRIKDWQLLPTSEVWNSWGDDGRY